MSVTPTIPNRVAIDTLTGQGASDFFEKGAVDPWRRESLVTFINLVINYDQVLLPLPGYSLPTDQALGRLLREGIDREWLSYKTGNPSQQIKLSRNDLKTLYRKFKNSLMEEELERRLDTLLWLGERGKRHERSMDMDGYEVPGIMHDDRSNDPVHEFTRRVLRSDPEIAQMSGIHDYDILSYMFGLTARTIQYYRFFWGDAEPTCYFPHSLRRSALETDIKFAMFGRFWSWGDYFLWMIDQGLCPNGAGSIAILIAAVRSVPELKDARWQTVEGKPLYEQQQLLEHIATRIPDIASGLGLPPRLKTDSARVVKLAFQGTKGISELVAEGLIPFGKVFYKLGEISLDALPQSEAVPDVLNHPAFQGQFEWPYLSTVR